MTHSPMGASAWLGDATFIVFVSTVFLTLLRFAWIGYFRVNQRDFIDELESPTIELTAASQALLRAAGNSNHVEGNVISIRTPRRTTRGRHLIVVEECVGGEGDEGENSTWSVSTDDAPLPELEETLDASSQTEGDQCPPCQS